MESDGEKVALTWFLHNACTSNIELATISNVCRCWRKVASQSVADAASVPLFSRCISRLLITDMARELVARQRHRRHECDTTDTTSGVDGTRNDRNRPPNNTEGNFCLAWFAPSGMQTASVSLEDDAEDNDSLKTNTRSTTQQRSNGQGRTSNRGRSVNCCPEWRGYRHATEVLIPFGYSTDFIVVSATTSASGDDDDMISYIILPLDFT